MPYPFPFTPITSWELPETNRSQLTDHGQNDHESAKYKSVDNERQKASRTDISEEKAYAHNTYQAGDNYTHNEASGYLRRMRNKMGELDNGCTQNDGRR